MKAAYLEVGLKSSSPAGSFSERLRQLRINGVKILFNNIDKHEVKRLRMYERIIHHAFRPLEPSGIKKLSE